MFVVYSACRSASGVTSSGIMMSIRWKSDLAWLPLLSSSMLIVMMQGRCSVKKQPIVLSDSPTLLTYIDILHF